MVDRQHAVLSEAIRHYGKDNQLHVALEEMSELQKELCKDLRGKGHLDAIAEEIADVEIMLEQLKMIYHVGPQTTVWKNLKINRLNDRMKNGEG